MLTKFMNANSASSSGSGSLPSITVANLRGDMKAITTRSGFSYDGPQVPPPPSCLPKVVEHEPEVTKDTVHLSTKNIQPLEVPLILGRPFLRITRALIDVHGEQMTLRHDDQSITFKVGDTNTFLLFYWNSVNRVDVIDVACEEFAQEVLGFLNISKSGNPTPTLEPILSTSPTSLTPFEGGDFILEEIEACLTSKSIPPGIDDADFDPKEDLLTLERLLNSDPTSTLPPEEQKFEELKTVEPYSDEPPELELKDLPPHLEYMFLEGTDKLPVIIAKDLKDEYKTTLFKVLRSHKRTIAWNMSDIKGIDPKFVIKKEVIKLLEAGLIYPISDSPWVSPVHCVPKKGGITVIENDDNELIPTRLITGWRVTFKYHRHEGPKKGPPFTLPYRTFAYPCMPFGLCNAPGHVPKGFLLFMPFLFRQNAQKVRRHQSCSKLGEEEEVPSLWSKGHVRSWGNVRPNIFNRYTMQARLSMTDAQSHYTTTEKELLAVVYAFEKFWPYLVLSKTIILLLQEFDIFISDKKGAENLAADHLSRLENPYQSELEKKEITEAFPLETLGMVTFCGENCASWSDKLDDALWAFRTAFKTPIGCTTYKLAYWALKHCNYDLVTADNHQKVQMNELNKLRD
ncbi:reverse transcriptase domain-containing protein [Tanacetum coccineum]